ncbi:MAG: hypothetical protein A3J49_15315 [Gallionellales bacterium RIFCSPHIGHO2_02_FULL_57_16]|nr:MAG: hypothetical protein A3J49_15315 [Gallionellales bacterium RIFCSPHIGHO2_02_FULL_57_16]
MEYRQDNDAMFLCAKINAVWKTIGDNAPNVLANNGKLERIFRCQRYATVNLGHELKSKAKTFGNEVILARFVPYVELVQQQPADGEAGILICCQRYKAAAPVFCCDLM